MRKRGAFVKVKEKRRGHLTVVHSWCIVPPMKTPRPSKLTETEIKYLRADRAALVAKYEKAQHPGDCERTLAALTAWDKVNPTIRGMR